MWVCSLNDVNDDYMLCLLLYTLRFNAGTDPEPALRDAFAMFDTEGKGKLHEE